MDTKSLLSGRLLWLSAVVVLAGFYSLAHTGVGIAHPRTFVRRGRLT